MNGLLRHGYDVHLHYANFGVRSIAVRLPAGMPFPKSIWSKYMGIGELTWKKDARGNAGNLSLNPYHEAGELEEIWSPRDFMDDVVELRNRLVVGDLRALYLLWLCAALDDQSVSPDAVKSPDRNGSGRIEERKCSRIQRNGFATLRSLLTLVVPKITKQPLKFWLIFGRQSVVTKVNGSPGVTPSVSPENTLR